VCILFVFQGLDFNLLYHASELLKPTYVQCCFWQPVLLHT